MSFKFHMEVELDCYEDADYETEEWFKLLDEFEERFRCYPEIKKELPCSAVDAHGINNGLCFMFDTSDHAIFAHANILNSEWFATFTKNNPKFYFRLPDLEDVRGINSDAVLCSIDNIVNMDSEWNRFVTGS